MPSNRRQAARLVTSLFAVITLTTLTLANWHQQLWQTVFAEPTTSEFLGSDAPEPQIEVRRINGRRLDMSDDGRALGALTGTFNIPGDYADLAAAITDLNASGVSGPVTLNLIAGNPQTAPAGGFVVGGTGSLVLTTTSSTNTVTIQGNGNTVTAPAPQPIGALNDGIFKLIGADWITISGFTMSENPANLVTTAGTNDMTEWGVALLYVTATDNANNVTISGNTIDLNRTYQNTFGIYANATHTATAVTTSATATGAAGGNSGLVITSNNVTDVNMGIVVVGPTAAADNNDGITIGGSAPNANTITNFGTTATISGYANVSGTVNGILIRNSKNFSVSFNSITSSSGGVTSGTLNGIQQPAASVAQTGTFTNSINNNTISLQSGVASGAINGINIPSGSGSLTSTLNINNNNFSQLNHSVAGTAAIIGILNTGSSTAGPLNHSISNNTFTNLTTNTTGSFTFISNSWARPTNGVGNINNNSIVTAFSKTGAGGTVTLYTSNSTSGATIQETNNGNNFSNITVMGATTLNGWRSTDGGSPMKTVTGNTFANWTGGTNQLTGLTVSFSGSATVSGNNVNNFSCTCAIVGLETSSGTQTLTQNTIHTLTGGSGAVTGILNSGGTTQNISRNKIYGLENTSATGTTNGILVSSGTTINVFNNLIGNLTASMANNDDSVRGLSMTSTTTSSSINASFNTVFLNASTGGINFGSSAVFHAGSATATTAALTLRDNIFVNTSFRNGSGSSVAFRRSNGSIANSLNNYGSGSNNNLFYAGIPAPTNAIYNDGANLAETLAQYKAGVFTAGTVAPRDSNSITENPPFLSTTGSSPNFLHISAVTPTQIESGGIPVTGITDDFDGDTRNAGSPDVGADEGAFTSAGDFVPPFISYTTLGNTPSTTNRVLSISVTDASGVPTSGIGLPVLYFRKGTMGAYSSTQCVFISGSNYDCTFNYALVGGVVQGDTIQYFVAAQDNASTPNVALNPAGGASGLTANPPAATTPPTSPNSYFIQQAVSGTYTVDGIGGGGNFASLTNAGGIFEFLNNNVITGNVTINISADLTAETGTVTLNQLTEEPSGSNFSVIFQPSGGTLRTISGSGATALINLNGADRVTFDGFGTAPSQFLFRNTVGGNVFRFINDATNDSILNSTIEGSSTSTVVLISTGATTGNDNITINNCTIRDRTDITGIPATLVSNTGSTGSAALANSNLMFTNNDLINFTANGFISNIGTENTTFSGNDISQTASRTTGLIGVSFAGLGTNTVSVNNIFNLDTSSTVTAIQIGDARGTTVSRNTVRSIPSTSGSTSTLQGINFSGSSGNPSSVTVANNMVSIIPSFTNAQTINGIRDFGFGGNTFNSYFNSVLVGGTASGTNSSWACVRGTSAPTTFTQTDNICFNNRTGGTGNHFAAGDQSNATGTFTSDYNIFVGTGATPANFFDKGTTSSGTPVDFATWQAGTRDLNSQASNPVGNYTVANMFLSTTDLHLNITGTNPAVDAGTAITGFTTDFDGDTRPQGAGPEIGADEVAPATMPGSLQFISPTFGVGEGAGMVGFDVSRTGGSDGTVTVQYATSSGTAMGGASCTAGIDFINSSGTLTFIDGDISEAVPVTICEDATFDPGETFNVTLSMPTGGATLGSPSTATVTINDNDAAPAPDINVTPNPVNFGNQIVGTTSGQQTITIQNTGTSNLILGTIVLGGTNSGDFAMQSPPSGATITPGNQAQFTATFSPTAPGVRAATITIPSNDPDMGENPVVVNLQGTGTQPGTIALSSATYSAGEGAGTATVTLTRTGGSDGIVGVSFSTSNGTATSGTCGEAGVDYQSSFGTLAWTTGDTAPKTFGVTICNDALFEPNETVNIAIMTPTGGATLGTPNTAVLTITENDTAPSLQFSSATYNNSDDRPTLAKGSNDLAPEVATITVTRNGATENAVSVNFATVAGGTATAGGSCTTGVDYISTSGMLSFASGVTSQTFNVTVCSDTLFEGNETVNLALSAPSAPAILGTPSTAVLTIVDNETQPTLQFSAATASIGEGGGTIMLTVNRTGAAGNVVSINFATAGGTATSGGSCTAGVDFVGTSGTLNFASGVTSQSFSVTVCNDNLFESSEDFTATLSMPGGGAAIGSPSTETVTITENDTAPTLQFSSATYTTAETRPEAVPAGVVPTTAITVTRTGATENQVTVNYGVLGGGTATGGASCTAGVDYITPSGTLTFLSGVTSQSFQVGICPDLVAEGDETVNLGLSSPSAPAVLGTPNTAVLTITDNDVPTITLSSATYMEDESQTLVVAVNRSGTGVTSSVQLTTGGGTATGGTCAGGADYASQNTTVTFTGLETTKTVNIPICSDMFLEFNETFNVTLSSPSNATLGSPSTATVTINETASQFTNMSPITITDGAMTSSTMNVAGAVNSIFYMRVTLFDIQQSVAADDLNLLLVAPNGITSFVLMSDAGGSGNPIPSGTTLTFNDNSATFIQDENPFLVSGSYKPTSYRVAGTIFPAPAPAVTAEPGPAGGRTAAMNTTFGGTNANGTWTLYIRDDNGGLVPFAGQVAGGWGLEFLAPTAAPASLAGRVLTADGRGIKGAIITIEGGGLPERMIARTGLFGFYSFEGLPAGHTYIVTVGAKRFTFSQPSQVVQLVDNVADVNFTALPEP